MCEHPQDYFWVGLRDGLPRPGSAGGWDRRQGKIGPVQASTCALSCPVGPLSRPCRDPNTAHLVLVWAWTEVYMGAVQDKSAPETEVDLAMVKKNLWLIRHKRRASRPDNGKEAVESESDSEGDWWQLATCGCIELGALERRC